ncbi:MAG: hypothetical protein IPK52_17435 [Chloroflexi bacterium]|nr:hypothetical protein [Chloroflexota bacterium]
MTLRLIVLLILLLAPVDYAQPLPLPEPRADSGSILDVLVVYTQNARAVAGGTHPQTLTMIDTAISGVNQDFAASGVLTQLNVIDYQPVFYLEQVNIDFHADLNNLTGTSDGFLDDIHALRDYYAADLVLMVAGTWFYIYTGDSTLTAVPDDAAGFVVWEAKGMDDSGGDFNAQWIARTMGVDATPPYDPGEVATLNANRIAVANYRDSADRALAPAELVINGGFEVDMDADSVPDFWSAADWGSGDKRQCSVPADVRSGLCSVRLKLNGAEANRLIQAAVGDAVNLNDALTLTGYAKTSGSDACVKLTLIVKFASLPKVKQPLQTCIALADGWVLMTNEVLASDLVSGVTAKVKATGSGKVWLDDFELTASPDSARGGGR